MRRVKITINNVEHDGLELEYTTRQEEWNDYVL